MPRPKTPTLSKAAISNAKKVLNIIAPHVPVESLSDVAIAESAINYALEQAEVLKSQLDAIKKSQNAQFDQQYEE
jgi:hypothetical protein